MAFRSVFAGWSENRDLAGVRVQGDTTRYTINWGDGTPTETVRYNEDFGDDGTLDAAFAWHEYTSDGTYQVTVDQPRAGLPPIRMTAYMYARDDDDLTFRTTDRNEMISTGNGSDNVRASGGDDLVVTAGGNDKVDGGDGDDVLIGGIGDDLLRGGSGGDLLGGGDGNDTLYGGGAGALGNGLYGDAGNDVIYGEAGYNYMEGGAGADRLYGGIDGDTFVFKARDRDENGAPLDDPDIDYVYNYVQGSDNFDVTGWADGGLRFIGASRFSGTGPELRYVVRASYTAVEGDFDGDRAADFAFRINGSHQLSGGDFNGVVQDMFMAPAPTGHGIEATAGAHVFATGLMV